MVVQQQPQQQGNGARQGPSINWKGIIFQMLLFYGAYTLFFKGGSKDAAVPTTDSTGKPLPPHRPIFKGNEVLVKCDFLFFLLSILFSNNTHVVLILNSICC